MIIASLSLVIVFLLVDKFWFRSEASIPTNETKSIAIFPFFIQGDESIQYLKDGMVDLISTKLNDIPGIHATDPNILLSRVGSEFEELRSPEIAGQITEELGASHFVLGSIVAISGKLRIKFSKYDIKGQLAGKTIVEEGTGLELYAKIDIMIRQLVAEELSNRGTTMDKDAILTTTNLEAIIPYLQGIQYHRQGKVKEAFISFEKAVEVDSTFALAYLKGVQVLAWGGVTENRILVRDNYVGLLQQNMMSLSRKNREIAEAYIMLINEEQKTKYVFEQILKKYGESYEVLLGLAEAQYHFAFLNSEPQLNALPTLIRLKEIDPHHHEVSYHLIELAMIQRDTILVDKLISQLPRDLFSLPLYSLQALSLKNNVRQEDLDEIANLPNFSNTRYLVSHLNGAYRMEHYNLLERLPQSDEQRKFSDGLKMLSIGRHEQLLEEWMKEANALTELLTIDNIGFLMSMIELMAIPDYPLLPQNRIDELIELYKKILPAKGEPYYIQSHYALAILHLNKKSTRDAEFYVNEIKKYLNDEDEEEALRARRAYYSFMAIKSYHQGSEAVFKQYCDSIIFENERLRYFGRVEPIVATRLLEAEHDIKKRRFKKALIIYEDIYHSSVPPDAIDIYWGLSIYRLGQIHQAMGNVEKAIAFYNRFTEVYKNCDEIYEPWVEDAKSQLTTLIENPEDYFE